MRKYIKRKPNTTKESLELRIV